MRIYNFKVRMYDEDGKIETREFNKIFEFSFPADGKFFYCAEKPILSDDAPGSAELKTHWIPVNKIIEIDGLNKTTFTTLKERKAFRDSLN